MLSSHKVHTLEARHMWKPKLLAAAVVTFAMPAVAIGSGASFAGAPAARDASDLVASVGGPPALTKSIVSIAVGKPMEVLGPDGRSINSYGGLATLADEHSTIFPPKTLPGHPHDYLFFVPAETSSDSYTSGLVVLSSNGPNSNGSWELHYASGYGDYPGGKGQIFISPVRRTACPPANSASSNDPTFDLNYANPGSVLVDPTDRGPREVFMVYEGTNRCIGNTGKKTENATNHFYVATGLATSTDYGQYWPVYRPDFTELPGQSTKVGPDAPVGAFGEGVCIGNNCSLSSPISPNYGRYPVVTPSYSPQEAITAAWPAWPTADRSQPNHR